MSLNQPFYFLLHCLSKVCWYCLSNFDLFSGNVWTTEILHLLLTSSENRKTANATEGRRSYFLEMTFPELPPDFVTRAINDFGKSRILKTHLPAKYIQKQVSAYPSFCRRSKVFSPVTTPHTTMTCSFPCIYIFGIYNNVNLAENTTD